VIVIYLLYLFGFYYLECLSQILDIFDWTRKQRAWYEFVFSSFRSIWFVDRIALYSLSRSNRL